MMTNIEYTVSLHVTVSFQTDATNLRYIWNVGVNCREDRTFSPQGKHSIHSNLLITSPLLSSHLYKKVTIFLFCHRKFHMN